MDITLNLDTRVSNRDPEMDSERDWETDSEIDLEERFGERLGREARADDIHDVPCTTLLSAQITYFITGRCADRGRGSRVEALAG